MGFTWTCSVVETTVVNDKFPVSSVWPDGAAWKSLNLFKLVSSSYISHRAKWFLD